VFDIAQRGQSSGHWFLQSIEDLVDFEEIVVSTTEVVGSGEDEIEYDEPQGLVPDWIYNTKRWSSHEMLILVDVKRKDLVAHGKRTSGIFLWNL